MRFRLVVRAGADRDIDRIAEYIAGDNLDAGKRFYEAVWGAAERLGAMPGMGSEKPVDNPRLRGLRCWVIRGFENYLIFYLPIDRGIEIVRVLHGARDVQALLERE